MISRVRSYDDAINGSRQCEWNDCHFELATWMAESWANPLAGPFLALGRDGLAGWLAVPIAQCHMPMQQQQQQRQQHNLHVGCSQACWVATVGGMRWQLPRQLSSPSCGPSKAMQSENCQQSTNQSIHLSINPSTLVARTEGPSAARLSYFSFLACLIFFLLLSVSSLFLLLLSARALAYGVCGAPLLCRL